MNITPTPEGTKTETKNASPRPSDFGSETAAAFARALAEPEPTDAVSVEPDQIIDAEENADFNAELDAAPPTESTDAALASSGPDAPKLPDSTSTLDVDEDDVVSEQPIVEAPGRPSITSVPMPEGDEPLDLRTSPSAHARTADDVATELVHYLHQEGITVRAARLYQRTIDERPVETTAVAEVAEAADAETAPVSDPNIETEPSSAAATGDRPLAASASPAADARSSTSAIESNPETRLDGPKTSEAAVDVEGAEAPRPASAAAPDASPSAEDTPTEGTNAFAASRDASEGGTSNERVEASKQSAPAGFDTSAQRSAGGGTIDGDVASKHPEIAGRVDASAERSTTLADGEQRDAASAVVAEQEQPVISSGPAAIAEPEQRGAPAEVEAFAEEPATAKGHAAVAERATAKGHASVFEQAATAKSPAPGAEQAAKSPAPGAEQAAKSPAPSAEQAAESPAPATEQTAKSPAPATEQAAKGAERTATAKGYAPGAEPPETAKDRAAVTEQPATSQRPAVVAQADHGASGRALEDTRIVATDEAAEANTTAEDAARRVDAARDGRSVPSLSPDATGEVLADADDARSIDTRPPSPDRASAQTEVESTADASTARDAPIRTAPTEESRPQRGRSRVDAPDAPQAATIASSPSTTGDAEISPPPGRESSPATVEPSAVAHPSASAKTANEVPADPTTSSVAELNPVETTHQAHALRGAKDVGAPTHASAAPTSPKATSTGAPTQADPSRPTVVAELVDHAHRVTLDAETHAAAAEAARAAESTPAPAPGATVSTPAVTVEAPPEIAADAAEDVEVEIEDTETERSAIDEPERAASPLRADTGQPGSDDRPTTHPHEARTQPEAPTGVATEETFAATFAREATELRQDPARPSEQVARAHRLFAEARELARRQTMSSFRRFAIDLPVDQGAPVRLTITPDHQGHHRVALVAATQAVRAELERHRHELEEIVEAFPLDVTELSIDASPRAREDLRAFDERISNHGNQRPERR
ncbi:MAG: hypothetical protein RL846_03695 [Deltaproteobacteria bacterium]